MLQAKVTKYHLKFKRPAGTSRGIYTVRNTWMITLWESDCPEKKAYGECAPLPDLSCDFDENYKQKIEAVCADVNNYEYWLKEGLLSFPSIRFGLETALRDLECGARQVLFDTPFTQKGEGLSINGLIWMSPPEKMREQIHLKLKQGYRCIKLKIGTHAFEEEIRILEEIRKHFSVQDLELRVDANGAFSHKEVMPVLERLARLGVHSIEQPIPRGERKIMRFLCRNAPLPIALDEELIGLHSQAEKQDLLREIQPAFLVLKPSLHGGMAGCMEWIDLAKEEGIAWWITSALESNIGLNAIAQWTASLKVKMPQGLGTGQLFLNNFASPLEVKNDQLFYNSVKKWDFSGL